MYGDLKQVAYQDHGEMYEWHTMIVWYSEKRRKYFWYSDAGCSCNSFGDMTSSIEDLQNGDRASALKAFKEFAGADHKDVAVLSAHKHGDEENGTW